jgi:uncharacterized membrane protein YdjX (TVP38/TMEM64 family)
VLLFAGVTIAVNQVFERVFHFTLLDLVQVALLTPGIGAGASIVGLLAVDVFLPVPSSIVMVLSGVLFGTGIGGMLSLFGSIIGNVLGYEIMQRYGPAFCSRFVKEEDISRIRPMIEKYGAVAVILSRPLPVVMETVSLAAGLCGMPRKKFFASSLIGTFPICFLYAYAGATSMQFRTIVPTMFMLVCIPAIGWIVGQRLKQAR